MKDKIKEIFKRWQGMDNIQDSYRCWNDTEVIMFTEYAVEELSLTPSDVTPQQEQKDEEVELIIYEMFPDTKDDRESYHNRIQRGAWEKAINWYRNQLKG